MKRIVAFLLLISHMNTSMFLPQVPQHDVFDEFGNQMDDINSVVEYIMVSLGLDDVADDEDNDQGQNFHIVNLTPCIVPPNPMNPDKPVGNGSLIEYAMDANASLSWMTYDVIIPPPKRA